MEPQTLTSVVGIDEDQPYDVVVRDLAGSEILRYPTHRRKRETETIAGIVRKNKTADADSVEQDTVARGKLEAQDREKPRENNIEHLREQIVAVRGLHPEFDVVDLVVDDTVLSKPGKLDVAACRAERRPASGISLATNDDTIYRRTRVVRPGEGY